MSAYRDPVFDAGAGIERKQGCPLAFLQELEAAKAVQIQEKKKFENRRHIRRTVKKIMSK